MDGCLKRLLERTTLVIAAHISSREYNLVLTQGAVAIELPTSIVEAAVLDPGAETSAVELFSVMASVIATSSSMGEDSSAALSKLSILGLEPETALALLTAARALVVVGSTFSGVDHPASASKWAPAIVRNTIRNR